ncbi:helix-turn-helix transcriptional regulator [Methylorubrum populi]|uniref:S24 family peptidase n=1 Tax=Methylorubrum rhodesianum TaxID=29427 RepID=UPI00190D4A70|nr:helix-turn-helix transcriptional regulator [Methylorubrum rhodesianum]MBK3406261.1 helix-turn-helix transcriptional regulator [Methylorubrum rhodesianum]MBY0143245.1 helix-turn-helix transcriptional regulator [Methylorubrum populi]
MTATKLARAIGRDKSYLNDFLDGSKQSLAAGDILKIEDALHLHRGELIGVSVEEIRRVPLGEEFDPDPYFEHDENGEAAGRSHRRALEPGEVPERNVIAGLGQGGTAEGVVVDGQVLDGVRAVWRLPPDFLRTELRSREGDVDFIAVDGDSMIPTLLPGDRVMINRSQTAPSPDGLYAIFDGIGISVKRLEIVKGSNPIRIRIKSDNPNHSTDEILATDLYVIGRVVCRVTRC